jgi:hypothetical protein
MDVAGCPRCAAMMPAEADPDGGEEGERRRRCPVTGEGARVEFIQISTGSPAGGAATAPVAGGEETWSSREHSVTGTCTTDVHPCALQGAMLATWMRMGGVRGAGC